MSRRLSVAAGSLLLTVCVGSAAAQDRVAEATAAFQNDVHRAVGLQCEACHVGRADRGGAPSYRSPVRTDIAPLCAKCHGDAAYMRTFAPQVRIDQLTQYQTSGHGKAMARGEHRAATCSDCHGSHGISRVRDPRSPVAPLNAAKTCAHCHADPEMMKAVAHDATPLADWSASVHATALLKRGDTSAPTCPTCHGSHGAAPPGVTEVASVCAQCHVREAELFNASPKKAVFDAMGQAECLVCHGNHAILPPADSMIGVDEPAVCALCHDGSTNGAETIVGIRTDLDTLGTTLDRARAIVDRAEHAGMLVDEARLALQEAREQQIQSRVLVHAFADNPFGQASARGLEAAARAERAGEAALAELQMRRRGLAVATLFIVGFLVTLVWKIRRLPIPEV
jgi:predicted CXXCH cytochrome family protein